MHDVGRNFMTTLIDHNKLLTKIAKARFKQTDIKQKGQSRTFLQDNFWFTTLIEFQPSSYDKGTYLNIGADFNFFPRAHFAFSYGYREKQFKTFKDENQFEEVINKLCDSVLMKASEIKNQLTDYTNAATILRHAFNQNDNWNNLDLAIINALSGDKATAKVLLDKIIIASCKRDWEIERQNFSLKLKSWLEENRFDEKINEEIILTRRLKKLDK
jgi:uncharacterized protein YwgA